MFAFFFFLNKMPSIGDKNVKHVFISAVSVLYLLFLSVTYAKTNYPTEELKAQARAEFVKGIFVVLVMSALAIYVNHIGHPILGMIIISAPVLWFIIFWISWVSASNRNPGGYIANI